MSESIAKLASSLLAAALLGITACGDHSPSYGGEQAPKTESAKAAAGADKGSAAPAPAPTMPYRGEAAPAVSGNGVVLRVLAEGEISAEGELTMPAMEQDMVYLMARVETEAGAPVANARITVTSERGNHILLDDATTDEYGYAAFTIYVAQAGIDRLTLAAEGVETDFRIDAMRLEASPWLEGIQGDGVTAWTQLRDAQVRFEDDVVAADFGESVATLEGETVRLAGYMMPMTAETGQKTFLLSASPPNCFYHMPGGPTTVVLVHAAKDASIPMSMDPLVVEGRLRLKSRSERGMLYELEGARSSG